MRIKLNSQGNYPGLVKELENNSTWNQLGEFRRFRRWATFFGLVLCYLLPLGIYSIFEGHFSVVLLGFLLLSFISEPYLYALFNNPRIPNNWDRYHFLSVINTIMLLLAAVTNPSQNGMFFMLTTIFFLIIDLAVENPLPVRAGILAFISFFMYGLSNAIVGLVAIFVVLFIFLYFQRQLLRFNFLLERTEDLRKIVRELRQESYRDPLTKLLNRRGMEELVFPVFEYQMKHREPISFTAIDLDFFKKLNDTYGHSVGDQILVRLAELLTKHSRPDEDFLIRLGGEEFLIVSVGFKDMENYQSFIDRLRDKIANDPLLKKYKITFSAGAYQLYCPDGGYADFHDVLQRADMLLYKVKNSGRNSVLYGRGCGSEDAPGWNPTK